jgi:hypothetical protein
MSDSLANVKFKNSLASFSKENRLITAIVEEIKKIPNYEQLKTNIEIIEHILQLIINGIHPTDDIDVRVIATKILNMLFTYSLAEQVLIDESIKYMTSNKIIHKKSYIFKLFNSVKHTIEKKLTIL